MSQNDRNFSDALRDRLRQAADLFGGGQARETTPTDREPPPGLLQRLMLCAPTPERARDLAQLILAGADSGDPLTPGETAYNLLKREEGEEVARRFLGWSLLEEEERPLFVLIGGASGTGKSTLAAALGERLGVNRIQSTDMLREVLRAADSGPPDPRLHASTFKAGSNTEGEEEEGEDEERRKKRIVTAFQAQSAQVAPAIQGVLTRAQKEGGGLILEGVHLVPGLPGVIPSGLQAVVIPFLLAVLDPEALAEHFRHRGRATPQREATHYLDHFEAIWQLQMHLLAQASKNAVQVVQNHQVDETVDKLVQRIGDHLADKVLADNPSP